MLGAIIGDIIGSRYEFRRKTADQEFTLFTKENTFTDDTVMTIAVAEALMHAGVNAGIEVIKDEVVGSMQTWGHMYPNAGYGGRFIQWIFEDEPKPYNSYGNGSAMRVSPAGWYYDTLERTLQVARATAEVTHDHPEGIKGAECCAAVIYLSRNGKSKEEIMQYVKEHYDYDFSISLEKMRQRHVNEVSCQETLPKALKCFFEGESYEDVVRKAVSLGCDTDTLAAIAGSMAEAYYGIPFGILKEGYEYLPQEMIDVLNAFHDHNTEDVQQDWSMRLGWLKGAISLIYKNHSNTDFIEMLEVLHTLIEREVEVRVPMEDVNGVMNTLDLDHMTTNDTFQFSEDLRLRMYKVTNELGELWIPLFTDDEELNRTYTTSITINLPVRAVLENGLKSEAVKGVVINPFGQYIQLEKELIEIILNVK